MKRKHYPNTVNKTLFYSLIMLAPTHLQGCLLISSLQGLFKIHSSAILQTGCLCIGMVLMSAKISGWVNMTAHRQTYFKENFNSGPNRDISGCDLRASPLTSSHMLYFKQLVKGGLLETHPGPVLWYICHLLNE